MISRSYLFAGAGVLACVALLLRSTERPPSSAPSPSPPAPKPTGNGARGKLVAAARAGKLDPITWVPVRVGDLEVDVASDALSAGGVRWPASFDEATEIARLLGAVLPTKAIADAVYDQASVRLSAAPQGTAGMQAEATARAFSAQIDKQIAGRAGLRAGGWKHYLLDSALTSSKGAVIYGFWKPGGGVWQPVSGAHDAHYFDYSQLVQPVKRYARRAGEAVDLVAEVNAASGGKLNPWLSKIG